MFRLLIISTFLFASSSFFSDPSLPTAAVGVIARASRALFSVINEKAAPSDDESRLASLAAALSRAAGGAESAACLSPTLAVALFPEAAGPLGVALRATRCDTSSQSSSGTPTLCAWGVTRGLAGDASGSSGVTAHAAASRAMALCNTALPGSSDTAAGADEAWRVDASASDAVAALLWARRYEFCDLADLFSARGSAIRVLRRGGGASALRARSGPLCARAFPVRVGSARPFCAAPNLSHPAPFLTEILKLLLRQVAAVVAAAAVRRSLQTNR